MIVITSKREGFRRCGVAHAAGPVEWPDGRWTEAELDALMAEPMLTVDYVEDPPDGDATPPPLGLVEDEDDPAVIEVDPPAAQEPYEIEFDEPAPETATKKTGRKKG
ncbi:MAG: HI1506-related protein [Kiritimatiellia bacterium]|jgi:hypothetical protein|nr:HI1506-related protein [Kiritimatiellia bacterium]